MNAPTCNAPYTLTVLQMDERTRGRSYGHTRGPLDNPHPPRVAIYQRVGGGPRSPQELWEYDKVTRLFRRIA